MFTYFQLAKKYQATDITRLFGFILLAGILFGITIELLQSLVQRGSSLHDVYRDVAEFPDFLLSVLSSYSFQEVPCSNIFNIDRGFAIFQSAFRTQINAGYYSA